MDSQGQKVAEQLMQIMLVVFAIGAFLTGYITESYQLMVYIYAAGVVLTTLVTVPNWPFFNLHPLKWLDPSESEKASETRCCSKPKQVLTEKPQCFFYNKRQARLENLSVIEFDEHSVSCLDNIESVLMLRFWVLGMKEHIH
ncbi:Microsomal signal peptidase 12kDa subunit [Artemisia annua]|uniref:Signal peptidase complex subunit 1 n=1 Tax=Artemisia annua TaxID=35608 RepID=A0A2U1KKE1_ARTAN|nr:Microsomal signal peptidase 12kDa subunit [Artemisia annua]